MTPSVEIAEVNWSDAREIIEALRHQVFVQEQSIDPALEQDDQDALPSTKHFLLRDSLRALAYGRVTDSGKIGRMCVLSEHRGQQLGRRLLQTILMHMSKDSPVYLHAQAPVIEFYQRCGFVPVGEIFREAGIKHQKMQFDFSDGEALEALFGDNVHRCDGEFSAFRHHLRMIAYSGRRTLEIFSQTLNPQLFDQGVADSISHLVRHHRNTEVRILVADTRHISGRHSPVVALSQRMSSAIDIRRVREPELLGPEAYCCVDKTRVVYFNDEETCSGFARYRARALAERLGHEFAQTWRYNSVEDPNLRRLSL